MRAKIPLGRFAPAEEIARHCLYQLSSIASWTTGDCLVVVSRRISHVAPVLAIGHR